MLSHRQIWQAIDTLAQRNGMSASGLARAAGLDPTTFNRSKRRGPGGKLRWPSTESVSKALAATGASMEEFVAVLATGGAAGGFAEAAAPAGGIPVIGLAQAGSGGFFDDGGFPAGGGWDRVSLPGAAPSDDEHMYALEITGDSMVPVYRKGDIIVVSPAAPVRPGDRVVAKTRDGEVLAKELRVRTPRRVVLASLNPAFEDREFKPSDLEWIARIVWARQ